MKKPFFYVKIICVIVFMMMAKSSVAQEVDLHQQTETESTTDTGNNSTVTADAAVKSTGSAAIQPDNPYKISTLQWDVLNPETPNESSFTAQSYNSVDLSTGKVNVRVPLATAGVPEIQVPIELNYSTGGIKLRDFSSWVGLGWNLSAGGKITRVMNRFPDKLDGSINSLYDYRSWTYTIYQNKGNFDERVKTEDTQPDLFYFDIPGYSGMFVLDPWGEAYTIPYQNIKINYDKTAETFEITDDNGNTYLFDDTEKTKIKTKDTENKDIEIIYKSAWNLTYISNIKGDYVTLEYEPLSTSEGNYFYKTTLNSLIVGVGGGATVSDDVPTSSSFETFVYPTYISKISWKNGSIHFTSSMSRIDIPENRPRLDKITLYSDPDGTKPVKSYNLGYTTFENNCPKLDKITVSTPKSSSPEFYRRFEYFTDQNLPFIVISGIGVNSNSFQFDHWGYYNGKTDNGNGFIHVPRFHITGGTGVKRTGYEDRKASLAHSRANSLKRVWLTSSGYEEFEYELHTAANKATILTDFNHTDTVGGLRIKSITTKATELSNVKKKVRYEYTGDDNKTSGQVFNSLQYYYLGSNIMVIPDNHGSAWSFFKFSFYKVEGDLDNFGKKSYFIVKDSPIHSLYDLDGSYIRYSRVKEIFDNGSSNTYYFTSYEDRPDQGYTDVRNLMFPQDESITYQTLVENFRDFAPSNTRFWQRGLLKEKISRDNSGIETYREQYEYNFNAPIKKTIHGIFPFVSETWEFLGSDIVIRPFLTYYDYISQPIYMSKKTVSGKDTPTIVTEYIYDDQDGNSSDLDHILLKKKIERHGGDTYTTTYRYPFDYTFIPSTSTGNAIQYMKDNNISSPPIEIVKYKNDQIIGGQLYIYDKWSYFDHNGSIVGGNFFNLIEEKELLLNKPKPSSEFRASGFQPILGGYGFMHDDKYVTKAIYVYDTNNKLTGIKERNNAPQSIIYGYNATLPIAKVINAEDKRINGRYYKEALHTSFEDIHGTSNHRAKTGTKVLNGSYYIHSRDFIPGMYNVSYWTSYNDGVDWELTEHEMEVIENQDRTFTIGGGGIIIDELRVYKKGAHMQTRTYDESFNVTSETDENGKTNYYEYDLFGRLITIRDNNMDVLKRYYYFIKND